MRHIGLRCFFLITCVFFILGGKSVHSKDLYVSMTGDNLVSYEDNSITTPWRSIAKGVYSLKAGDTLHIRGGDYSPPYSLRVRSDYDTQTYGGDPRFVMNAESGTADLPVTITGYADEKVLIDLEGIYTFIHLDNKSYWTFENLGFVNGRSAFYVGQNSPTTHNVFRNLYIKSKYGGDNSAAIHLSNANSENTIIQNNLLIGPGTGSDIHGNTSLIYLRLVRNAKILNNEIRNAPMGIYYKHTTLSSGSEPVDIEIAHNFIENTSRDSMSLNTNYARIHNNIFGLNNASVTTSNANGAPGGDNNVFENNTFYSRGLNMLGSTQDGDATPGSQSNIVKNNIFYLSGVRVHYFNNTIPHNTDFDFNLFAPGISTHSENKIAYSLEDWVAHSGSGVGSIVAQPGFVGGNTSLRSASDYTLENGSPGYRADSNGNDMGANAGQVGSTITIYYQVPRAPTSVSVQ